MQSDNHKFSTKTTYKIRVSHPTEPCKSHLYVSAYGLSLMPKEKKKKLIRLQYFKFQGVY